LKNIIESKNLGNLKKFDQDRHKIFKFLNVITFIINKLFVLIYY
jgi:hypothetical protein